MSIALTFRLDYSPWTQGLATSAERARNLPPVLRLISRAGVASTRRRFQTGRDPMGRAWKKGRKASGQTLIDSALLLRSVSDRPPEANAVEWGSNRSYARIHQDGFDGQQEVSAHTRVVKKLFGRPLASPVEQSVRAHSRRMVMPARPYLGVSAQDERTFASIFVRYVAKPLGGPAPEGATNA